ncbi:hypothetical protein HRbin36_01923 [bacterium HR36]|nr:hypothetical protein HRbin36_01923 [bacterium HR36]
MAPDDNPIHYYLHLMPPSAIQVRHLVEGIRLPIYAHPQKTSAANLLPERTEILAFFAFHGSQYVQLGSFWQALEAVNDFIGRLGADGDVATRAVHLA